MASIHPANSPTNHAPQRLAAPAPVRVLAVTANPRDDLDVTAETSQIEAALQPESATPSARTGMSPLEAKAKHLPQFAGNSLRGAATFRLGLACCASMEVNNLTG